MNESRARRLLRRTWWLVQRLYLFAVVTLWPAIAMAQPDGPEEDAPKKFVNQYALVILLIAMGVIVATKPSGREEQVKQRYVED